MNYKERWSAVIAARKASRKARKAIRKLQRNRDATWQQRNAWKCTIAKAMRASPTKCEAILYDALKESGIQFFPQMQVGPYIADAFLPEGRVVVEVDGPIHQDRKEYDLARDSYLWNCRYRVIRFTNREVSSNPKLVIEKIKGFIAECSV